ncbi:MAG: tetrathionate reductase family octaheme c-type cytochrome [Xanthomonadales bacterium]|nr:tetrathionate reductase family octaheme c-type cytochrome [Gammaproteobacteria bacterium]MBT8076888.1 tetrathionate reductase family octaheme c-type cytochrome [Gammaproteobacteria bacterium]NNK04295.1 tetrathionate reductase family octaheme c-type cytochrome [Xanthomonadales bacterium]
MKSKFMAAWHAALFIVPILTLGLLLIPSAGLAAAKNNSGLEKADLSNPLAGLVTPADYIEYASINDVDIHELYFSVILWEGTESCLMCHADEGEQMLDSGHFKWKGDTLNIVGLEKSVHGKTDLLNNFCIAVDTNEGRCTQCHAGYGWKDKSFDFNNPANIDCLVCHDQSGTYAKAPTTAGLPAGTVDLNVVAQSVGISAKPTRKACIGCHAKAGGGDNVKHGDISTDLISTTREYDVHMGVDGANLVCADCHGANHDPKTGDYNHGIAGMSLHSIYEGEMKQCRDCHGSEMLIHKGSSIEPLFAEGFHGRLACQVCHIPAIARKISTKVEWYWSDAGQNISPVPIDPETGRPTYDKKKGTFVWKNNVRPTLRYSNGKWNRKVVGVSDTYDEEPIQMAYPEGSFSDPDAMIYPFKLMKGNQVVDPINSIVSVPHLFGKATGPNPYWGAFDWNLALQDGSNYTGQPYSGTYGFAATEMLLSVNHEIAPAQQALGMNSNCGDCHGGGQVDFPALGWTDDPFNGGERVDAVPNTYIDLPSPTIE